MACSNAAVSIVADAAEPCAFNVLSTVELAVPFDPLV